MSVYEVQAPDRDAARAIALRLYASLRQSHDWGQRFGQAPAEDVLERMCDLAPRDMRRAWTTAFGNAKLDGRDAIELSDLPAGQTAGKRGPLGFMSH